MTYIADTHPDNPDHYAAEQRMAAWDTMRPDWENMAAGESARFVDYSDVSDPDTGVVWGYGGDHRVYLPGADGQ